MGSFALCALGIGLAMDAFAVSVCDGLCYSRLRARGAIAISLCFGLFQGMMPLLGFFLGTRFSQYITVFDHWVALVLLGALGGRMLWDARKEETLPDEEMLTVSGLLLQGVATSIDALAVGISLAALQIHIFSASALICTVTFLLSLSGVYIGKNFGTRLNRKAKLLGGSIMLIIAIKIFLEHTWLAG